MRLKKALIILFIIQIILVTGCWNSREINTLAISVCIGIDKTDNGYMVTEQIINPKAIASQKAINESPVVLYTATGDDLFEIIRSMTTQCPRKIYSSHLRMFVFSEEVAKDGIQDIIDYCARDHEFRTDFYFVVAKNTTANKILSTLTNLESIPGIEMYSSLKASERNWAPTKSIKIVELINSISADGKNPVLTGIEITDGADNSNSVDTLKQSDNIKRLKYTQLGVFKKDKLVGWLNGSESKGYNFITGNVKSTIGHVFIDDNVKITSETMSVKSSIKVNYENGQPVINVMIKITSNIGIISGSYDITREENLDYVNKVIEDKIKDLCEVSLKKAQKDLQTDIYGFGEAIHRNNPKIWNEIKDNWDERFIDIPVDITVKVKTERLGQITNPLFMKEEEE